MNCNALAWVTIGLACVGGIFLALLGRATVRRRGDGDMGGDGGGG